MERHVYYCSHCMAELADEESICKQCGKSNAAAVNQPHQLPCGTILAGKYLIGCSLGQGGFGITYVGLELNLGIKVAIKEYYPEGCVTRNSETHTGILTLTGDRGAYFENGKRKFVDEARVLAKFASDPCIVSVRDYFQENGTAYIVMDYIEGITLKNLARQQNGRLPAAEVLLYMRPLIHSLHTVHESGMLHRDISPDNIMVRRNGAAVLLDFGAARQISAEGERSNTINVKHGFAPEEQYRTHGEQGPWTDVYALCATIYNLTTGVVPPQAMDRVMSGIALESPRSLGAGFTGKQERAILRGLSVHGAERQKDMEALERELYGDNMQDGSIPVTPQPLVPPAETPLIADGTSRERKSVRTIDKLRGVFRKNGGSEESTGGSKSERGSVSASKAQLQTYYRKGKALEAEKAYGEALAQYLMAGGYPGADKAAKDAIAKIREQAVLYYRAGRFTEARDSFAKIARYYDSAPYETLMQGRMQQVCSQALLGALTALIGFEDANEILLKNWDFAKLFLAGNWQSNDAHITFVKDGDDYSCAYNIPVFEYGSDAAYDITDSHYVTMANGKITQQWKITILDRNSIEVYAIKTGRKYRLVRE